MKLCFGSTGLVMRSKVLEISSMVDVAEMDRESVICVE
jgi:hypothetical protein